MKTDDFIMKSRELGSDGQDSGFGNSTVPRYISLEESFCVLDIALLANDSGDAMTK